MVLLTQIISSVLLFIFIFCTLAIAKEIYVISRNVYLQQNYEFNTKKQIYIGCILAFFITYIILI